MAMPETTQSRMPKTDVQDLTKQPPGIEPRIPRQHAVKVVGQDAQDLRMDQHQLPFQCRGRLPRR
jgi:hypothetical protein